VIKRRKECVIMVRPKVQQRSKETKKEKIDIKNMDMKISKFKKL